MPMNNQQIRSKITFNNNPQIFTGFVNKVLNFEDLMDV